jgi:hypothetical protein
VNASFGGIAAMRKARLLFPLILLFGIPVTGQAEHAITPEQCRADADLWSIPKSSPLTLNDDQFTNLTRDVARNKTITAKKLDSRIDELSMCMRIDSLQSFRYERGSRAYNIAMWFRMADFVSRHNLTNQFYQEDDQGQR